MCFGMISYNYTNMETIRRIPYWAALGFIAYMPLHIFLAQSLSLLTGGLEAWKIAKDVILMLVIVFTICLVFLKGLGKGTFRILFVLALAYAGLHLLLWAVHPDLYRDSTLLGLIYNSRVVIFAGVGLGAALLLRGKINLPLVIRVALTVSTVVVAFGVAQYFLPKDFLTHFGYGLDRGTLPAFFIDDKPDFPRVMSTLRDPNSLGAYLILPMTLLAALGLRAENLKRRLQLGGLFAVHALALLLTFSRGAWAAALLSLFLLVVWQYGRLALLLIRRFWPVAVALALLATAGLAYVRNTYAFKSYITHSTGAPKAEFDSNGFHIEFAKRGLNGIADQPLGHGPGTAGLASIQNPDGSFLTENYYIQIGYEVGIPGLLLFIAINVLLYVKLWAKRASPLALALLCAFWGYFVMNMLFHTWSNEAVAAQWWLLAGLMIGAGASAASNIKTKKAKTAKKKPSAVSSAS
jgi:hypothetical protein